MPHHLGDALNELADKISIISENKGFWENPDPLEMIPIKLALIHSEVSEALDVHRKTYDDSGEDELVGLTDMQEQDFTEELADAVIRILDLAGYYELDIGNALVAKVEHNRSRPHKHSRRY